MNLIYYQNTYMCPGVYITLVALLGEEYISKKRFLVHNVHRNQTILFSSSKNKHLLQLGILDNDVLEIVEIGSASNDSTSNQAKSFGQSKNSDKNTKSLRSKIMEPKKLKKWITSYQVNNEERAMEHDKEHHSVMMTLVFEEAALVFKSLRHQLNVLSLKNTVPQSTPQAPKSRKDKAIIPCIPSNKGIRVRGKPGKMMYSVLVGDAANFYKSSKKKSRHHPSHQNLHSLTVYLHGAQSHC